MIHLSNPARLQHPALPLTNPAQISFGPRSSINTPSIAAMPQPPTLLTLPAEIRHEIYTYALTSLPYRTLYFDYSSTDRFDVSDIGAGLLTTCRQLYEETRWMPLQLNTMEIGITLEPSKKLLACVKKLEALKKDKNKGWDFRLSVGLVREKGWDRD